MTSPLDRLKERLRKLKKSGDHTRGDVFRYMVFAKDAIHLAEAYREIAKQLAEGPGNFDVDKEAEILTSKEG